MFSPKPEVVFKLDKKREEKSVEFNLKTIYTKFHVSRLFGSILQPLWKKICFFTKTGSSFQIKQKPYWESVQFDAKTILYAEFHNSTLFGSVYRLVKF